MTRSHENKTACATLLLAAAIIVSPSAFAQSEQTRARISYERALLAIDEGNFDRALTLLEESIPILGPTAEMRFHAGWCAYETGQFEKALDYLYPILDTADPDPSAASIHKEALRLAADAEDRMLLHQEESQRTKDFLRSWEGTWEVHAFMNQEGLWRSELNHDQFHFLEAQTSPPGSASTTEGIRLRESKAKTLTGIRSPSGSDWSISPDGTLKKGEHSVQFDSSTSNWAYSWTASDSRKYRVVFVETESGREIRHYEVGDREPFITEAWTRMTPEMQTQRKDTLADDVASADGVLTVIKAYWAWDGTKPRDLARYRSLLFSDAKFPWFKFENKTCNQGTSSWDRRLNSKGRGTRRRVWIPDIRVVTIPGAQAVGMVRSVDYENTYRDFSVQSAFIIEERDGRWGISYFAQDSKIHDLDAARWMGPTNEIWQAFAALMVYKSGDTGDSSWLKRALKQPKPYGRCWGKWARAIIED